MRHLIRKFFAVTLIAGIATASAEEGATGVVVTTEGLSERCILTLVLTSVDGEEVDAESSGTFDLEPGPHHFGGYAGDDPTLCATFNDENAIAISEGDRIGEGEMTLNVAAGKEYYLGVDVRSRDKSKWKIVAWKIKH
jgi:hypothetical protein